MISEGRTGLFLVHSPRLWFSKWETITTGAQGRCSHCLHRQEGADARAAPPSFDLVCQSGGVFLRLLPNLENPSKVFPEICLHGDSKSYPVVTVKHHTGGASSFLHWWKYESRLGRSRDVRGLRASRPLKKVLYCLHNYHCGRGREHHFLHEEKVTTKQ